MSNPWNLSPREAEVLQTMASIGSGSAKQAAREIGGLTDRTVEIHVHNAMKKMGAATRLGAVLMWDREQRGAKPALQPSESSLLRDFNTCPTCGGLGFVRKACA